MNALLKLAGPILTLAAGFAGAKVVDVVWTKVTGNRPPRPGDAEAHASSSFRHVLAFAMVSAAIGAAIEVLTGRGTQMAISRLRKDEDEV